MPPAQQAEYLEDRSLMSVSALVVNGNELDIIVDGEEDITIQATATGQLQVLVGSTGVGEINRPLAPLTNIPVMQASELIAISIYGGSDQNVIDLSQVSPVNGFNAALTLVVTGGDGHDILIGSPVFANELHGGDGADTLFGGDLGDTLDGGNGAEVGGD